MNELLVKLNEVLEKSQEEARYLRSENKMCIRDRHTDWNFKQLMFGYIHSNNSINDMTFFCNTSSSLAHFVMRAAFTGRWHVFHNLIRIRNDSQMCCLLYTSRCV